MPTDKEEGHIHTVESYSATKRNAMTPFAATYVILGASLVAQLVKNPPAMQGTWVRSLGLERLPTPVFWPRESLGLYIPWGHKELDTTEQLSQVVLQIIILNEVSQRKTTVI